jgi:hypothetical protein
MTVQTVTIEMWDEMVGEALLTWEERALALLGPDDIVYQELRAEASWLECKASEARDLLPRSSSENQSASFEHSSEHGFLSDLKRLPPRLRQIGLDLLIGVRERHPGKLRLARKGSWVESPDNFWTVKIQPMDGSLAITVRGIPDLYLSYAALDVRPDRGTYSRFKLYSRHQLPDTLRAIRRAAALGTRRKHRKVG